STPSTPLGQRATRCAHATHRRPLQIFRSQRKRTESSAHPPCLRKELAQVAQPKESASAQELERFRRADAVVAASAREGSYQTLANISMRRPRRRSRMVE